VIVRGFLGERWQLWLGLRVMLAAGTSGPCFLVCYMPLAVDFGPESSSGHTARFVAASLLRVHTEYHDEACATTDAPWAVVESCIKLQVTRSLEATGYHVPDDLRGLRQGPRRRRGATPVRAVRHAVLQRRMRARGKRPRLRRDYEKCVPAAQRLWGVGRTYPKQFEKHLGKARAALAAPKSARFERALTRARKD